MQPRGYSITMATNVQLTIKTADSQSGEFALPKHTPNKTLQRDNFALIRLLLAIFVIYSHAYGLLSLPEPIIFGRTLGNFAVHCFFAVSGYFITQSFVRLQSIRRFTLNRFLRIVPGLLVAWVFSRLMAKLCNQYNTNPVPWIINGPVWTLTWEVVCYAFCGMLGGLGILNRQSYGVLFAGLLAWSIWSIHQLDLSYQVLGPLWIMFMTGSLIALNESYFSLKHSIWVTLPILGMLLFDKKYVIFHTITYWIPFAYAPPLTVADATLILYWLALPFFLIYMGGYFKLKLPLTNDLSYGTYIYAWPVSQVLIHAHLRFQWALRPIPLFIETLALTLPLAYLSWRFVEKPALSLKNRFFVFKPLGPARA